MRERGSSEKADALRREHLDEAETHAWNALLTIEPGEAEELRRIAHAVGNERLEQEVDARWPGLTSPPAVEPQPGFSAWRRRWKRLPGWIGVVAGVFAVAASVWHHPTESGPVPATRDVVTDALVARPIRDVSDGIWLVPLGRATTVDLDLLARELSSMSSRRIQTTKPVVLPTWARWHGADKLIGRELLKVLNLHFNATGDAWIIGITDFELQSVAGPFEVRGEHFGVVSTSRLGASVGSRLFGHTRHERVRKLVKRQLAYQRRGRISPFYPDHPVRVPVRSVGAIDDLGERW